MKQHIFIGRESFKLLIDAIESGEDVLVEAMGFDPVLIPSCKTCKKRGDQSSQPKNSSKPK